MKTLLFGAMVGVLSCGLAFPGETLADTGCPAMKAKSVDFAAAFDLRNRPSAPVLEPLKLWISGNTAEIYSSDRCEAVCRVKNPDKTVEHVPFAMDLDCRSNPLGPLTANVSVVWKKGRAAAPVVRFGTWLTGYEEAILSVQLDRFPRPDTERNLAKAQ